MAAVGSESNSLTFVSAAEAAKLQTEDADLDMRPYIFDGNSKQHCLWDSGSQVCAWPPDPGDKVDQSMTLKAVNGSKLVCYGVKEVKIRTDMGQLPISQLVFAY